jgi:hypothetical protein
MARTARVKARTSPPSIPRGVLHLVTVTGQTAARDVGEVGAQLLTVARDAVRGTQSASAVIAGDLADVARRTVRGISRGIHEVSEDVARLGRMARKPGARMASRRRSRAQRSRRASGGKARQAS